MLHTHIMYTHIGAMRMVFPFVKGINTEAARW